MAAPVQRTISAAALMLLLASSGQACAQSLNGFDLDGALIPVDEIMKGGPPRDGIPSLDYPAFVTAGEAGFLKDRDRILGLHLNGRARAYPVRILNYHEVVNDVLAGTALAVTYCPLCGSGVAFESEVDGRPFEFGVSGLLYNSDVLLYDRQTDSLWSQIGQRAVTGDMKGARLTAIPMTHTTWRDWRERHPESAVLSIDTGHRRDYRNDPYEAYRRQGRLMFPVAASNSDYRRKSLVMGLEVDGYFKAYPFEELGKAGARFTDEFRGRQFEVLYDDRNETASIVGADGSEIPTLIAYWFAWYAFHPDTEIYRAR